MTALTPEERVRRVKAALAEAGYPHADVFLDPEAEVRLWPGSASPEAWWRAKVTCGLRTACWPCWDADRYGSSREDPRSCSHDPLTSPWPEVVR